MLAFQVKKLIKEALLIEKAGAFSIVLECVDALTAKKITKKLSIPTIELDPQNFAMGKF